MAAVTMMGVAPDAPAPAKTDNVEKMDADTLRVVIVSMRDAIAECKRRCDRLEQENANLRAELSKKIDAVQTRTNDAMLAAQQANTKVDAVIERERQATAPVGIDPNAVLAKHLEATPEKYIGSTINFRGWKFSHVAEQGSDYEGLDRAVQIVLLDSEGRMYLGAFAPKGPVADEFLNLARGTPINFDGKVLRRPSRNEAVVLIQGFVTIKTPK
ncbi:MAG: hypothetical protein JSS51_12635 [Planctomycetes bacterium]|nr:hypothetical protein [Planctomycetota bacterium]